MSDKSFVRRDTSRRGGFTLLEVAIALAIFVFGALAIIRIFPPALGVIQNSGDQLTAVNFNRSTLARFARQPGLVPDALYDTNPANGWRDNIVGSVAGTPRRNNSLPVGTIQNIDLEYNLSALG
ncbi:MAG: prepilin-type N-terminal cleavage/methylation domain-containing protein, partial [Armatimonadetes bacterium]|nr:prepilin-type N-terminal cleavage/methylation domain-containing protein [Armatimonadota bacterium]